MSNTGSRSNSMVELVDAFPTLTELVGLETPGHLQGTSLVPLLQDPKLKGEKAYAYSVVTRRNALGYAIRNQTWRYGKWPNGEELYDLTRDPHERDNLANNVEHSGRLKTMRKVLAMKQKQAEAKREAPGVGASELR
jgi:arylsulfatase A-like enzyme